MSTPTPRTDAAWASSFEPCEYRAAHTARTMRDECAKLECELATAKAILASIEEDGTEEHNAAVRLRQELAAERARLDYIDSLSPGDAWGIYRAAHSKTQICTQEIRERSAKFPASALPSTRP